MGLKKEFTQLQNIVVKNTTVITEMKINYENKIQELKEEIKDLYDYVNRNKDTIKTLEDSLALANDRISDLERHANDETSFKTAFNEWMENPIEA